MANVCSHLSSQLPTSTVILFDSMRSLHKLHEVRALERRHFFQLGLLEVGDSDYKHTPSYPVRFRNYHPSCIPSRDRPHSNPRVSNLRPATRFVRYVYIITIPQ